MLNIKSALLCTATSLAWTWVMAQSTSHQIEKMRRAVECIQDVWEHTVHGSEDEYLCRALDTCWEFRRTESWIIPRDENGRNFRYELSQNRYDWSQREKLEIQRWLWNSWYIVKDEVVVKPWEYHGTMLDGIGSYAMHDVLGPSDTLGFLLQGPPLDSKNWHVIDLYSLTEKCREGVR